MLFEALVQLVKKEKYMYCMNTYTKGGDCIVISGTDCSKNMQVLQGALSFDPLNIPTSRK